MVQMLFFWFKSVKSSSNMIWPAMTLDVAEA